MNLAEAQALLDSTTAKLSEHFGSVQIVASIVEPNGGTRSYRSGSGDWYARRALCQEFVELDQADTMARKLNPPDEDDKWKEGGQ
jgi:hypothetical protein